MPSRVSPKSLANLRKGGGRPRGKPNRIQRNVAEFYRLFVESPDYQKSARARMLEGKAPHLETLAHHYAYGKPRERLEVTGADGTPFKLFTLIFPRDEASE